VATAAVVLAVPGVASAAKYKAYAGEAVRPPKSAPKGTALNAFQPARMKVRAGDTVQYLNNAFHTVSVIGSDVKPVGLAGPDGTEKYSGINDPQGNPFFFNGLQKFKYNEQVFGPVGSTPKGATIGDGKTHSSGAFFGSQSGPGKYNLKFAKPGKYTVVCLIHPGMKQTVTVLKKKAKGADSKAKVQKAVARQTRALYKAATKASKTQPGANTVYAGIDGKQATLLAYLPNSLTVAKGTTVTFMNMSPSEVHNMTFGPSEEGGFVQTFQTQTDLFPAGPGTPNQVSPPFIYGSEPTTAPGTYTYSGNEYGNGFLWTPLMDDQPGDPPAGLPGTTKITFDTPGTFKYFCAIHGPDMSGEVIVK
jgi:plastocyanin